MQRKARARGRRRRAERDAAGILAAPIDTVVSGDLGTLVRRTAPAWPSESRASRFSELLPAAAAAAREEADALLAGRLRLFGALHPFLKPDGLPDWNYAPRDPAFAPFVADVKFPWEVARLAFVPRLGAAYAAGDNRCADAAACWLSDWCRTQAVGRGVHFSSALEVGIRLIALCQAFHFFGKAEAFDAAVIEALVRHTAASAAWLDGHLSTERVVAGNHLLGELAGLVVTDLYFPEFGGRARLARNLPLFAREVERQVAEDGVSLEQSTTYGRFVADFIAAVLATARATGTGVPGPLRQRAAALAGWLAAVTGPGGTLPLVGDNDNGKGVDWGEPEPSDDARGVAAALAVLAGADAGAGTPHVPAGAPAGSAATLFWWTGEAARTDGASGRKADPAVTLFPRGGHAVLSVPGALHVFVRCGPFGHGLPKPSAHSHADWMAPVVHVRGRPLLVDPGNYGYTSVGADRNAFRVEDAHSTFTVGGAGMAVPGAPFRWDAVPEPATLEAREDGESVRWTGRWRPAAAGKRVACARTLVYNKTQRFMTFEDEWVGDGLPVGSAAVWRWRFPAEALVEAVEPGFRVSFADGASFLFQLEPAAAVRVERGFLSPRYGEKIAAPVVVVERPAEPTGRQITRFSIDPSPGGSP